jgi:hypothetical protein
MEVDSLPTNVGGLAELRILCQQKWRALPKSGKTVHIYFPSCRNPARLPAFVLPPVRIRIRLSPHARPAIPFEEKQKTDSLPQIRGSRSFAFSPTQVEPALG